LDDLLLALIEAAAPWLTPTSRRDRTTGNAISTGLCYRFGCLSVPVKVLQEVQSASSKTDATRNNKVPWRAVGKLNI
jgi:hypothetical protein